MQPSPGPVTIKFPLSPPPNDPPKTVSVCSPSAAAKINAPQVHAEIIRLSTVNMFVATLAGISRHLDEICVISFRNDFGSESLALLEFSIYS
jgi:hypothetical protein